MRRNSKLSEGMREGDLADLVLPLISCDEYTSKVDSDECIVFGFYVHDETAADDLNRFVQKSPIPIMDTEISAAPDQHGYYMLFVELLNNDRLPENMTAILAEIKSLVDIEHWQMRVRKIKQLIPFSEDNLKKALHYLAKRTKQADVLEFLQASALHHVLLEHDLVILQGKDERHVLRMVKFDRLSSLMNDPELLAAPIHFGLHHIAQTNRIRRSLGENWDVIALGDYVLLQNMRDNRGLLTIV